MPSRIEELIEQLGLEPHPEGGFYRELFRAQATVQPSDARPARSAITAIYYLLRHGDHSRWHRVRSDEVWHFYEGEELELYRMPPDLSRIERLRLGRPKRGVSLVESVPAGWWQAAQSRGAFTLAGCTVGPGFDFSDFAFLKDDPESLRALSRVAPDLEALA